MDPLPPGASGAPVISVRSEVERSVDPDRLTLHGHMGALRENKEAALLAAAVTLDAFKSALGQLGAVALTASTARHPLTWSVQQIQTHPYHDPATGRPDTTIAAAAQVVITLRDLERLPELEKCLMSIDGFQVGHAQWQVDHDNPAWAELRAEAIREALQKGRDYAAALDARLVEVLHVADVGLLGGEGGAVAVARSFRASGGGGGPMQTLSLDHAPQVLMAHIEARFRTTPIPL